MREIKFRGKRVDNGEWVYGDLIHRYSNWIYIAPIPSTIEITPIEIDPETVGQYTGLKDKNGKEIYEGDVVKIRDEEMTFTDVWGDEGQEDDDDWNVVEVDVVRFKNGAFVVGSGFETKCISEYSTQKGYSIEVIGNIYENPELLKEVKE